MPSGRIPRVVIPSGQPPNYKPLVLRWPFLVLLLLELVTATGLLAYAMRQYPMPNHGPPNAELNSKRTLETQALPTIFSTSPLPRIKSPNNNSGINKPAQPTLVLGSSTSATHHPRTRTESVWAVFLPSSDAYPRVGEAVTVKITKSSPEASISLPNIERGAAKTTPFIPGETSPTTQRFSSLGDAKSTASTSVPLTLSKITTMNKNTLDLSTLWGGRPNRPCYHVYVSQFQCRIHASRWRLLLHGFHCISSNWQDHHDQITRPGSRDHSFLSRPR
jgi:hypothetical protein